INSEAAAESASIQNGLSSTFPTAAAATTALSQGGLARAVVATPSTTTADTCQAEPAYEYSYGGGGEEGAGQCRDQSDAVWNTNASCAVGTDCANCGPRSLCTSCPAACRARGLRMGRASFCWEHEYVAAACARGCNNWECGSPGCSLAQRIEQCVRDSEPIRAALVSVPGNYSEGGARGSISTDARAGVEVRLEVRSLSVKLNESFNLMQASVEVSVALQWRDSRLASMPCRELLPRMFTATAATTDAERQAFDRYKSSLWWPQLSVQGAPVDFNKASDAKLLTSAVRTYPAGNRSWAAGSLPADGSTLCSDCITQNLSVTHTYLLPPWSFTSFPFDTHNISLLLSIPSSHIFNCAHLLGSVLIVCAGLSAPFLDASLHSGDRVALILSSVLVLQVTLQADLNLGKLSYLLWFDYFNLMQMGVLVVALLETVVEHRAVLHNRPADERAAINTVGLSALLFGVYPTSLSAAFLFGIGWSSVALLILGLGFPLIVIASACCYKRLLRRSRGRRELTLRQLRDTRHSPGTGEFGRLLTSYFSACLVGGGHSLSSDDVRALLCAIFSLSEPSAIDEAMSTAQAHADEGGQFTYEGLVDGVSLVREIHGFREGCVAPRRRRVSPAAHLEQAAVRVT
ncbi:MAG: hypothetical protein SGPRY_007044, partial [Prymnesium sp.]